MPNAATNRCLASLPWRDSRRFFLLCQTSQPQGFLHLLRFATSSGSAPLPGREMLETPWIVPFLASLPKHVLVVHFWYLMAPQSPACILQRSKMALGLGVCLRVMGGGDAGRGAGTAKQSARPSKASTCGDFIAIPCLGCCDHIHCEFRIIAAHQFPPMIGYQLRQGTLPL